MSESEEIASAQGAGSPEWEAVARSAGTAYGASGEADRPEMLRELLVFGLEEDAYAIPVERVREIVRMRELTRVPRSPDWLLGVLALRGEVVEIVDLRARLQLGVTELSRATRIIVLHGDVDHVTGILVDSVSEVFRVSEDAILPAQGIEVSAVDELCPRGAAFVSILDVDRALGIDDV